MIRIPLAFNYTIKKVSLTLSFLTTLAALFLINTSCVFAQPGVKTDHGVYPVGVPPTRPAKGGKVTDPVFGTEIMRVTDATTDGGANFVGGYSYWPTFNSNNTKLLAIKSNGTGRIYDFNPTTFALGSSVVAPDGVASYEHAVYWSRTNPNLMYGVIGLSIKVLDVSAVTPAWSTIGTYTAGELGIAGAANFVQIHISSDDNTLSATVKNSSSADLGFAAVRINSSKRVYYAETTSAVNEVQISKNGRYIYQITGNQGANVIEARVIDLQATPSPTVVALEDDGPHYAATHHDLGSNILVGADNWRNAISFRSLANPTTSIVLIQDPVWAWMQPSHFAMATGDEWLLVSTYGAIQSLQMNNELWFVKTDGSGAVRRFAHHYSVQTDYYSSPRANISLDNKFVAFTSNWGVAGGRLDLFVAKVPSAALPSPSPSPSPSPTPFPSPSPTSTPLPTPSPTQTPAPPPSPTVTPNPGNVIFENVAGFSVQADPMGRLDKLTTPYNASADTTGSVLGDGWFSFKYNSINEGLGVNVSLRDGINNFTIVNQGVWLEIRINGAYRADFLKDLSKTYRIERVGNLVKVWEDSTLKWTSSAEASSGAADFKVSCGGEATFAGLGINSALISTSSSAALVTGRVTNASNRGLPRIIVRMTDSLGVETVRRTNSFGFFRFDDVAFGSYDFSFSNKHGVVATTSRSIQSELHSVDIVLPN